MQCCLEAFGGLPLASLEAATCVAQARGLAPSKKECRGQLQRPVWVVETVFEDECDAPHHQAVRRLGIDAWTTEVAFEQYATYTTLGECR